MMVKFGKDQEGDKREIEGGCEIRERSRKMQNEPRPGGAYLLLAARLSTGEVHARGQRGIYALRKLRAYYEAQIGIQRISMGARRPDKHQGYTG